MPKTDRSRKGFPLRSAISLFVSAVLAVLVFIALPPASFGAAGIVCLVLASFNAVFQALALSGELSLSALVRDMRTGVDDIACGNFARRFRSRGSGSCADIAADVNRLAALLEDFRAESIRSEAARKRLLSDISHDIRTPLTSIIGYIDALRDGIASGKEEEAQFVEILATKSRNLKMMIDDIFQLAKLDAGEIPMKKERFDACEECRELLAEFYPAFREAGIEPLADIPGGSAFISCDRLSFSRMVRNLLQNACVHGCDSSFVSLAVSRAPGSVLVSVTDRGRGIREEDLGRVFTRLYRRDQSRAASSGGSGLGLAITHALAQANGAEISVRSACGKETTFVLSFPDQC